MKKNKIKNLEKRGWKVGNVSEFLNLSRNEEEYIETKGNKNSWETLICSLDKFSDDFMAERNQPKEKKGKIKQD